MNAKIQKPARKLGANRKDFEVAPEPPELPRELAERWAEYWGLARPYERGARREDRGDELRVRH